MNGNGTFAPAQIGLPADQFAAAFPFHFAVDDQLRFVQVGATLQRLCADVHRGEALADAQGYDRCAFTQRAIAAEETSAAAGGAER